MDENQVHVPMHILQEKVDTIMTIINKLPTNNENAWMNRGVAEG